uniref:Uncharacterized protein n=1 Tax=Caenorhabditis japonica TaxID=281687 RepID=A0A8R1E7M7_CAEJA
MTGNPCWKNTFRKTPQFVCPSSTTSQYPLLFVPRSPSHPHINFYPTPQAQSATYSNVQAYHRCCPLSQS